MQNPKFQSYTLYTLDTLHTFYYATPSQLSLREPQTDICLTQFQIPNSNSQQLLNNPLFLRHLRHIILLQHFLRQVQVVDGTFAICII